eukprot:Awhi_evm1s2219
MLNHLFSHLDNKWSLSVLLAAPWSSDDQLRTRDFIPDSAKQAKSVKISRYFARLGSQQLSDEGYWFLEKSRVKNPFLPKTATASLAVTFAPTPPPPPTGVNQLLMRDIADPDKVLLHLKNGA